MLNIVSAVLGISPQNRCDAQRAGVGNRGIFALWIFIFAPVTLLACVSTDSPRQQSGAGSQATPTVAAAAAPLSSPPLPNQTAGQNAFDGKRAFTHVTKMVAMGPRPAGSAELAQTREYIIGELRSYGLKIRTDEFSAKTPVGVRKMVNITAELPGAPGADVLMLASHYDTKPFEKFRFVGANDGGSSTAALLELARVLATTKRSSPSLPAATAPLPRYAYWFVFFDGEEAFCQNWDDCSKPNAPDNTYGSRRYVKQLTDNRELKQVRALVLLDMIGYTKLEVGRDSMSTSWMVDIIWRTARELGHGKYFVDREEGIGGDDHEPFLRAGIDAVDIIQLNTYPHWHTAEDTLDKISPGSLKIVGDVVLASLPRIEERLSAKSAGVK